MKEDRVWVGGGFFTCFPRHISYSMALYRYNYVNMRLLLEWQPYRYLYDCRARTKCFAPAIPTVVLPFHTTWALLSPSLCYQLCLVGFHVAVLSLRIPGEQFTERQALCSPLRYDSSIIPYTLLVC